MNKWYNDDVDILDEFIEEKTFVGRGYTLSFYGEIDKGLIPEKDGNEDFESNWLKKKLSDHFRTNELIWFKCFPGEFLNDIHEVRPILIISGEQESDGFIIDGYAVFCIDAFHMDRRNPLMSVQASINRMDYIPDSVYNDIIKLMDNRFADKDFSLIGKPMPSDKSNFHTNPPYSISCNAGWRTAYWHMQIDVDENDIIKGLEYSSYENFNTMFMRPKLISDDPAEYMDCINYICDQYSDEEWKEITKS